MKFEFFYDRFEITSPGTLLKGLKLENILTGTSKLRNPGIAKIFEMLDYIEAYGTGFKRIFDLYDKFDMKPEVVVLPNFFRVIMPNIKYDESKNVVEKNISKKQEVRIKTILELITNNENISSYDMAVALNTTERTIQRDLQRMKETGIIDRVGADKGGYWRILK